MSAPTYLVRRMTAKDADAVALLETLCFPHEPWSAQSLLSLCRENGIAFVAVETDGTISAYVGMQYAAGEGSITNVATNPDYRRGGRAAAALRALIDFAATEALECIFLEVRPTNAPAIALYERYGFMTVGRRKNFYREPTEDALILRVDVDASADV